MIQSFISETIDDILLHTKSFEEVVFILPSQRAKVFVKQTFKDKITAGFLPEMITIQQFVQQVSKLEKADNLSLLFHFYAVYKTIEKTPDSFDVFTSWATTVLQDFNEIDQYLINTQQIFFYLKDIERLRKWSVKGTFQETKLIKDNRHFLEKLHNYYSAFYSFLLHEKMGYQGLLYREACKNMDEFLANNLQKQFFFIGFNALNTAEEFLFQKVLENKNAEIYWDIDAYFLKTNHQAAAFIKKYKNTWKHYENNDLKLIRNNFEKPKNIQIIGAPKNTTQIKYLAELLATKTNFSNTALILADETLLPITLNSLPKNCNEVNITMGYPLKDVPTTSLILAIFQLFISQEKLQKVTANEFYYKDVFRFFKHQSMYSLLPNSAIFLAQISDENQTFITQNKLEKFLSENNIAEQSVILNVFNRFTTVDDFLDRILTFINLLKDTADHLEKEYLFRFYTAFNQLKSLQKKFTYFTDLKIVASFFKQLIASESLSFQGEPLKGLQIMGMLETRVIDFKNVIIASTNEGVLPANSNQNSFIPFDVKVQFNLPTYQEKDTIFSYHFFRLLQRAQNVFLLYNSEQDNYGNGEKSRFVKQLQMMRSDFEEKTVSPRIITEKKQVKFVKKDALILDKLKDVATKGFSPSSITNYLHNPIAFYKQKVLGIREFDEVEETVASNTLGTIVHETLNEMYHPFIGKFLQLTDVQNMQKNAPILVDKQFQIHFKNGDTNTGKNRLIFEVAKKFVTNFLAQEMVCLQDENNQLKIIATEKNLSTTISIEGFNFPIKIKGQVDRIDELNGEIRIIDYKTGKVDASNLNASDFELLREDKYHKAIQVLLYAYLFYQDTRFEASKKLTSGVISFKNLQAGYLSVYFSLSRKPKETAITEEILANFLEEIKGYIKEIMNPELDFIAPTDLKY